jgi:hypothetical protein
MKNNKHTYIVEYNNKHNAWFFEREDLRQCKENEYGWITIKKGVSLKELYKWYYITDLFNEIINNEK